MCLIVENRRSEVQLSSRDDVAGTRSSPDKIAKSRPRGLRRGQPRVSYQATDVPRWPPPDWWPSFKICCERSTYVSHALLGLRFNGTLWFRRQLQNRGLLTFAQAGQEHDLAIWKFQRVVMRRNLVFVDLPKDRRLVLDDAIMPRPQSNRQALNLVRKSQLSSGQNAYRDRCIFGCSEASRAGAKVARGQRVANFRRPRFDAVETVVAHHGPPVLGKPLSRQNFILFALRMQQPNEDPSLNWRVILSIVIFAYDGGPLNGGLTGKPGRRHMSRSAPSLVTRVAYGVTQLPRVAWYLGHGLVLRRLSEAAPRKGSAKARRARPSNGPVPDRSRIYADMAKLFLQDLANVEAGLYPLPADHDGSLFTLFHRSQLFFADLPAIHRRRERRVTNEVLTHKTRGKRPRYYLQNFHFQSGGWMTDDSAERYDTQVEVLLNGAANAMRRQALPAVHAAFAGRDQRQLRLLDIGCGTGRFLDFVKQAWPRLQVLGLDMSDAYIRHAKRHLSRTRINFIVAKAETIPLPDNSQDVVTCIFLLHELPPKVRRLALREAARVLKPGGRLVLLDSLQRGDQPDYEGLLERFPRNYHEPYYSSYVKEDIAALAADCGMSFVRDVKAFVSKVMIFDKR
jgi:ubiquinone/menaquinone biosynthesis C-methylase UbiE